MTSKELLYVKTVVEEGSVSLAAKKLYMSQPSLSQSLKRIESGLSCELFVRSANGLRLTLAGEEYYKTASKILRIYDDMQMQLSSINDLKIGKINLGITRHLGRLILPEAISSFRKDYPNVEINISEDTSKNLEKQLISGEISFALMHILPDSDTSHLECEVLSDESFVILSSPNDKLYKKAKITDKYNYPLLDIKHIKHLDFISLGKEQGIRQMSDLILKRAGINKINSVLNVKSYMTALEFAAKGMGIMIFPEEYIHYYKTKGEFSGKNDSLNIYSIPVQYKPVWQLCIAYPKDAFLSKADKILLNIIRKRNYNE
jgi:hypothetical protein